MTREPDVPRTRRERRALERHDRPIRDRSRARRPKRKPAWQSPFAIVTAGALLVAIAVIVLAQRPAPTNTGGDLFNPPITYSQDIVDGDSMGSAVAPVVMEVWSDFQCPVCGRLVRDQFQALKGQFVETGVLRIQAHDIAFLGRGDRDESLELATGAACAAEQDRYWSFHDFVFWNQGRENAGDYSAEFVAAVAERSGVDRAAWDACMAGEDVRSAIRAATQAALGAGINATPTIALNGGTPVAGLPDANQLIAQIQALAATAGPASPVPTPAP